MFLQVNSNINLLMIYLWAKSTKAFNYATYKLHENTSSLNYSGGKVFNCNLYRYNRQTFILNQFNVFLLNSSF